MAANQCHQLCRSVMRKKTLEQDLMTTPLRRCLNLFDVVLFGLGQMVGAGIFVITGTVTKNIAGPGIVLSYLLAGIAAALSSLCYAEFGARVPKAGSAYTYTYVIMGEIFAFFIGWNMILEYVIGTASVARAWSATFDSLFDGLIRNKTMQLTGPVHLPWVSEYLDFIGLLAALIVVVFIAAGARVSTTLNSVLTVVNVLVLVIIIGLGFYLADINNWTNPDTNGFLPFGFTGVIAGAGSCFYAFIGFEGIAVAGEEMSNPSRTIPVATGLAMGCASLIYIACSAVLTLMVPWNEVDAEAPYQAAFIRHGLTWAKYFVAVGALIGISTSLIGSLFCLPRAVYAMASDGLLFRSFAVVNQRTQTPILAIIVFGLITGLTALLLDIEVLVELMSIGTLFSYTFVAASVIILHYQPVADCQFDLKPAASELDVVDDQKEILERDNIGKLKPCFRCLPVLGRLRAGQACVLSVLAMTLFMTATLALLVHAMQYVVSGAWWSISLLIVCSLGLVLSFLVIVAHEQNVNFTTFQVPLCPLIPALSIMFNIGLILLLNHQTWTRLVIWMLIGFSIYLCYGVSNSSEREPLLTEKHKRVILYSTDQSTITSSLQGKD